MATPPDPDKVKVKVKVKKGRKRRLTGWTLIALGLLVAAVWAGSTRWFTLQIHKTPYNLEVTFGCLIVDAFSYTTPRIEAARPRDGLTWSLREKGDNTGLWAWFGSDGNQNMETTNAGVFQRSSSRYRNGGVVYGVNRHHALVLWPIPLLLWAAGVPVLRSGIVARRRALTGACGKCGYSLAGLGAGAPCPECGS